MIKVEGYKAFRGAMRIVPKNGFTPFEIEGEWLYKPDTKCWYCNGRSFSEDICEVANDTDEKQIPKKVVTNGVIPHCPNCNDVLDDIIFKHPFCDGCGQALEWGE